MSNYTVVSIGYAYVIKRDGQTIAGDFNTKREALQWGEKYLSDVQNGSATITY